MADVKKTCFIGRVTHDLDLRRVPSGDAVVEFSIAINERFTRKDGNKTERTDFFDLTAWGKQAEILAQYVTKGRSLYLECDPYVDKWEDKTTGEKRQKVRFKVKDFQFLGDTKATPSQSQVANDDEEVEEDDDDSSISF